jgi:hypothetical protein
MEGGRLLDIASHFRIDGKEQRRNRGRLPPFAAVPYEIPRRCVATCD